MNEEVMANEKESQFQKDLKANQDASDKLDKELNAPLTNAPVVHKPESDKPPLPDAKVPAPVDETLVVSAPVKKVFKTRKQEILEEYGGTRSDVPINHPEFWNL